MRKDPAAKTAAPLRPTFDSVAELDDAARPPCPHELFDDLVTLPRFQPGSRLLEVGCATGKATRPLLERGFSVVCVELGGRLAEVARRKLAGLPVEIHVAPFETWPGQPDSFDLVYGQQLGTGSIRRFATARRTICCGRVATSRSGARRIRSPPASIPYFSEVQEVYDAIGESYEGECPSVPPNEAGDEAAKIEASGLFRGIEVRLYI